MMELNAKEVEILKALLERLADTNTIVLNSKTKILRDDIEAVMEKFDVKLEFVVVCIINP